MIQCAWGGGGGGGGHDSVCLGEKKRDSVCLKENTIQCAWEKT